MSDKLKSAWFISCKFNLSTNVSCTNKKVNQNTSTKPGYSMKKIMRGRVIGRVPVAPCADPKKKRGAFFGRFETAITPFFLTVSSQGATGIRTATALCGSGSKLHLYGFLQATIFLLNKTGGIKIQYGSG
jgi:hypothetical protein